MKNMIAEETYLFLKSRDEERFQALTIADVRIGLRLTAVKLSDGSFGVASTLEDDQKTCPKWKRDFEDFSPSKIRGRNISGLFETPKQTSLIRTLRVAALCAISSALMVENRYTVLDDKDPFDLIDLRKKKTITMVGAFQSYIRKITETGNRLFVLEFDESALSAEHKKLFVPARDYQSVIPRSDIVIMTGLTLVNDTIDKLLNAIPPGVFTIVSGPSCSQVPDILFRHGVDAIGAAKITDGDLLFTLAAEGGAGYHLFEYCARKICIVNDHKW